MDRTTIVAAPALTLLSLATLGYTLLADHGSSLGAWMDLGIAVLFVAIGWLSAAARARRGSYDAASALLWWTFAATALFAGFAG